MRKESRMYWVDEMRTYRYISDDVDSNVVKILTNKCQRSDCKISATIKGSTMMGCDESYYNKDGQKIVEKCNHYVTHLSCQQCNRAAMVHSSGTIKEEVGPLK